ncbi:integrase core domain-containing protein [Halomonas sp. AOP35-4E-18]|uniref:integrase core domain-containing protein n=1 Tax=Halomonas sp. AOP35-4E-18 TaxID=3457686 RepID=UPI0040339154
MQRLNITPSHSRPRVSNDNAFSESLFRTYKYRPNYPVGGYDDLAVAQHWVAGFMQWYNHEHRHSAIPVKMGPYWPNVMPFMPTPNAST